MNALDMLNEIQDIIIEESNSYLTNDFHMRQYLDKIRG